MSELTEKNPEEGYATYLQEDAVRRIHPVFEIDHEEEQESRQHPPHEAPRSHFHLVVGLERVRRKYEAGLGLGAGLDLGAVLCLPPSLLLGHDSTKGVLALNGWSERPQGIQPSRPVGAEEEDDCHCMIPRGLPTVAIGHVGWDKTDWHVADRGCQP